MWQFHKRGIVSDAKYEEWLKGRNGVWKNGSRLYFVSDLVWTFEEINLWSINPKTGLPKSGNDHIIGGALKYVLGEEPYYEGKRYDVEPEFEPEETHKSGRKYVNYP
jgi:hypothetical protein